MKRILSRLPVSLAISLILIFSMLQKKYEAKRAFFVKINHMYAPFNIPGTLRLYTEGDN